ncbi:MAG TPA: Ig-like domain-containing protein [Methylobacterium sp.]|jgi:hypothetical protein|uniref:Ig-like domain-containing protein n=1 Tax=Methylorubrum sp. B1-46 TaxID=2897334 RepID=UPI001E3AF60B|nr:Ig-like domain-containing protein [Methylorubrum sp. B1-46]UGB25198.1 hypothetical protein LPC10_20215 [Methylorubrum sp. B1-46]HEV2542259.1 Ig-like domain-containing protein [Methylobacterium sp.]
MHRRSTILTAAFPAALSTALATALSLAPLLPAAARAMPMGGSFTGRVESQAPQVLGPNEVKLQQTASGLNTGPGTPLDGARVQWVETVTLKNGQGPVEGTITFTTPGGSTSSLYRGTVTTDAQGRVTATGTYRDSAATGEFAGVKGKGTFSLAYSSKTEFSGQWQGEVRLPGQKSSKR